MRLLATLSALFLSSALVARADVVNFTFNLNPDYGPYSGSGSFSLDLVPAQTTYTASTGLDNFVGQFGGTSIGAGDLAVSFQNNAVTSIAGSPELSVSGPLEGYLEFHDLGYFGSVISQTAHNIDVSGAVSVQQISTDIPEPTSMLLFGSGLVGLVGAARERARHAR